MDIELDADISAISAQYGTIPDGPVDGVLATFADAWRAHFAPLLSWVEAHGELPTHISDEDLLDMLGATTDTFGRYRGIGLIDTAEMCEDDREDAYRLIRDHGEGLYIEVNTRLGGGNRECWCEITGDDTEHYCYVETIEAIQAMPGYVADYDETFDRTYADFYFRVEGTADLAARKHAYDLLRARVYVLNGTMPPWFVFDVTHEPPSVEECDRARRDRREAHHELARELNQREEVLAALVAPVPATAPTPRRKQRVGARGRTLKGTEPVIPRITYAEAVEKVNQKQELLDTYLARQDQIDALLADPAYDLITADFAIEIRNREESARLYRKALDDAIIDRDVIAWRAHSQGTSAIDARIEQLRERIARCDSVLDSEKYSWVESWPGDLADCPPLPKENR